MTLPCISCICKTFLLLPDGSKQVISPWCNHTVGGGTVGGHKRRHFSGVIPTQVIVLARIEVALRLL